MPDNPRLSDELEGAMAKALNAAVRLGEANVAISTGGESSEGYRADLKDASQTKANLRTAIQEAISQGTAEKLDSTPPEASSLAPVQTERTCKTCGDYREIVYGERFDGDDFITEWEPCPDCALQVTPKEETT